MEVACKERAKDRHALPIIICVVPPDMKKSAYKAWEAVKSMHVGDDRVKALCMQHMWKEFENLSFWEGESITDFSVRIEVLVGSLRKVGEKLADGMW